MESKHTPLPWHYQGWDDTPGDCGAYILGGGPENSADEYMVGAALPLPITNREECEANARFIVKAVNAHDALVEVARLAATLDTPTDVTNAGIKEAAIKALAQID